MRVKRNKTTAKAAAVAAEKKNSLHANEANAKKNELFARVCSFAIIPLCDAHFGPIYWIGGKTATVTEEQRVLSHDEKNNEKENGSVLWASMDHFQFVYASEVCVCVCVERQCNR